MKAIQLSGFACYCLVFSFCTTILPAVTAKDNCYTGPAPVVINQDADIYLGVLLNVREMAEETGKCGTGLHREAIELYESLRWYLSFINQNSGQVASRLVKDSLIPGMKLGLKIFDACGDADLAERQLAVLFPELLPDGEDESQCDQVSEHNAMIGLIDFVGLTDEKEISEQLNSFSIPFMSVRLDDFLPAEEVAEALVEFSKQMMWDRISVLYADDDYSLAITKSINLKAVESGICFESYHDISRDETTYPLDTESNANTVFLVISPPEDSQNVTRRMMNDSVGRRIQWLFAEPWAAEKTELLEELSKQSDVYSLALSPIIIEPFEIYWNTRKNPQLATFPENLWFLEYFSNLKKCRLPEVPSSSDPDWMPCHNFNVPESSLDRLLRHTRVMPAVHVLNTFTQAFRKARDSKCSKTEIGYCSSLREMTRPEFSEWFDKLQIQHGGPGNRVPSGFVGSKKISSHKISDVKFSLIRSIQPGDRFKEIFSYHKASGIKTIDRSITLTPTLCPEHNGCMNCVFMQGGSYSRLARLREEATELAKPAQNHPLNTSITDDNVPQHLDGDLNHAESIITSQVRNSLPNGQLKSLGELLDAADGSGSGATINRSVINNAGGEGQLKITDIIIPALFAVHKAGPTPLQCSAEVNPEAIQDIEAFLWALDLINRNVDLLNGIEIGAVIFDTCSSSIKAAHLVSTILAKEGDPMLEEISINPDQLLAVVSAATGDETEAAASVLAPNLITTISAKERSDSRLATPHQLQVAVPMSVAARAVIDLLNHSGWTYVSVIYSSHDVDSVAGFRHFQQLAENTQICIGFVEKLNQTFGGQAQRATSSRSLDRVFEHLATKLDVGSKVVVLWTDEADTQTILAKAHLLSPEAADRYKQLIWISANGWISGGRVQNMVKDVGKWLAIRPQVKPVIDFEDHFSRLRPDNNERNPWFGEYWEQITKCQLSQECPPVPRIQPSTTTVIQTVYVIASGLARLIEDYCPDRQFNHGVNCSTNSTTFRETLLGYLQNTGTDRPGDSNGEFGFTDEGYGDTPLEIVEVRGGFSEFTYHSIAVYDQDTLQFSGGDSAEYGLLSVVSECSSGRKEICSGCAAKQQNQMLIKSSKDRLYIMGLFDVREKNMDGLWSCSTNVTNRGIQQTEAFLWALDHVNNKMNHILPGVQLGAIGLDGCETPEKRTAEIARAFSSAAIQSGIGENQILGLVVGTSDTDPRMLFDLHHRHHLPILLSAPGLEMQNPPGVAPLFQLSPSISSSARVLSDILRHMNWTYVSVVCSSQLPHNAICEEFQNYASKNDVTLAVDLAVNEHPHLANYWENVASMIATKSLNGARVLIVLLPDRQLLQLLIAIRKLPGISQSLILITSSTDRDVDEEAQMLAGHIHLKNSFPESEIFFRDFEKMKFQLSSPNPWLLKYWTQRFQCRGAACQKIDLQNQISPDDRDETVINTINGVLAVAQGLERVRQQICPDFAEGICPELADQDIRKKVEREIMDHSFVDLGGRPVEFMQHSGVSQDARIEIVNTFRRSNLVDDTERRVVGNYSLRSGLILNVSKLKSNINSSVVSMDTIVSKCLTCQNKSSLPRPQWYPSQYMQVQPVTKPGFSLVGLLPFHRQGLKPLSCGTMHSSRVFQNLAAVAMTLDRLRLNGTVPASLQIGAVFFDTCGRVERAQQRLLSFVSDNSTPIWSSSIIGALTLDGETALAVGNVLSEASIPQFTTAIDGYRNPPSASSSSSAHNNNNNKDKTWHSLGGTQIMQTVPSPEDEVKAMFDVVQHLGWKHVVIFYDDSQAGASDRDLFLQHIQDQTENGNSHSVCVGAQIRVNKFGQGDTIDLHSLLEAVTADLPALSVAVLLLDNPAQVQHVLMVLEDVRLASRFIVLANHAWGNHRDVLFEATTRRNLAGVLAVSMETYPVPGFNRFLANMTLENHSTIPDDWFEEYFQHQFECHLLGSKSIQRMYPKQCSGSEQFELKDIEQDPYVYHTVAAVETYVRALHEFLQLYCPAGMEAVQLSDCGPNSLERFNAVVNDMIKREPYKLLNPSGEPSSGGGVRMYRGVVVWNAQYYAEKTAHYERVGFWRQNRLELDKTRMKFYVPYAAVPSVECLQGPCLSVCSVKLSTVTATQRTPTPSFGIHGKTTVPESPTNVTTAWGVVAIVFCILGLLACMACVSYFIRHIPNPSPTTVLNYFILAGIALLYIATTFFLIQPSEVSCGLRRFFLGLAYAIIFAGMLVRCIHVWRRTTRGESRPSAFTSSSTSSTRSFDLTDATKPPGLVFTTMTLVAVQVILLSAWLIFKPPTAYSSSNSGLWRCSPAENFESELVISLILPIVLLFTATLFSVVVWRSSDAPKDSRSTTACCALLAFIIVIWTLVATQASYPFREPAIVLGNILCAKTILLLLYGRKVYDISVRRQESRNLAVLSQFTSKSLQPSLQTMSSTNRNSATTVYTTDLDGDMPTRESYASHAEDPAMGLCLGLAAGSTRQSNESYRKRHEEIFQSNHIVPYPPYPQSTDSRSVEGDRDLSDSDEFANARYRMYSQPTSRTGSVRIPSDGQQQQQKQHQPPPPPGPTVMVRRVGSRQMLVLGDEASIHGRVSKI